MKLIEKHRIMPLFLRGNRLFIAQVTFSHFKAVDDG